MSNAQVGAILAGIFQSFRNMDRAAINRSYYAGHKYPTGLRHFDSHQNPNTNPSPNSRPRFYTEDAWTNELAIRMPELQEVTSARPRPCYPSGLGQADLLVCINDARELWFEIKGAWKYDRFKPHEYVLNPAFVKHFTSRSEGVPRDFEKLRVLQGRANTIACVLVVGFDRNGSHPYSISDREVSTLTRNAQIDDAWCKHYDEWDDIHQVADANYHGLRSGFRVRCWAWTREMGPSGTILASEGA